MQSWRRTAASRCSSVRTAGPRSAVMWASTSRTVIRPNRWTAYLQARTDALAAIGTARPQIEALLRQRGLALRDVFLLMADRAGHLHIVRREGGAA